MYTLCNKKNNLLFNPWQIGSPTQLDHVESIDAKHIYLKKVIRVYLRNVGITDTLFG